MIPLDAHENVSPLNGISGMEEMEIFCERWNEVVVVVVHNPFDQSPSVLCHGRDDWYENHLWGVHETPRMDADDLMAFVHRGVNEKMRETYRDVKGDHDCKCLVDKDQRHEDDDHSHGSHHVGENDPVDVDHLHKNLVYICPNVDDSREVEGDDDVPRVMEGVFQEAENVD